MTISRNKREGRYIGRMVGKHKRCIVMMHTREGSYVRKTNPCSGLVFRVEENRWWKFHKRLHDKQYQHVCDSL